jgi:hypothetical protein
MNTTAPVEKTPSSTRPASSPSWWNRAGILLSLLGIGAGIVIFVGSGDSDTYESRAKLLPQYLIAPNTDGEPGGKDLIRHEIVGEEMAILRSQSLARSVALAVGPERILPNHPGPESSRMEAATSAVLKGLVVSLTKEPSIIDLAYLSSDPELPTPVLSQVVDQYFRKHFKIHRPIATSDNVMTVPNIDIVQAPSSTQRVSRPVPWLLIALLVSTGPLVWLMGTLLFRLRPPRHAAPTALSEA